ncbi:DUF3226 domain-containing protein [Polyangium aurulentum]|uniref:DUF3226 domain-containing protein n=1 Tax=Polyangium aurulentum TaxID=2567896 RepID=UPI0010AE24A9|nr:DUF3226 domain-containing protein [Polyangium aurulentum]UQA55179.1 hypothetical protein E8A73_027970 [Polyangium aurulentum]
MPPRPTSRLRLTVEGKDDQGAIIHLLKRHGIDWDAERPALPNVEIAETVDKVLDSIAPGARSYDRYGVVLDADASPAQRWAQVRDRLAALGLAVPAALEPRGLIVPGLRPGYRIGVWVMPDNGESGILEDFLAKLVPTADPCWSHAQEATAKARQLGARLAEKDVRKGELHAWLAWQERPGMPFGTALTAKVLGHDSAEALRFVDWFRRLFFDDTESALGA